MDRPDNRVAVVVLGIVAVAAICGAVCLEALGRPASGALATLAATALGSIATLTYPRPPDHRP